VKHYYQWWHEFEAYKGVAEGERLMEKSPASLDQQPCDEETCGQPTDWRLTDRPAYHKSKNEIGGHVQQALGSHF